MIPEQKENLKRVTFALLFLLMAMPQVSSSAALVAGFAFSVLLGNPLPVLTERASKALLKISVVGLGFGTSFFAVIEIGKGSLLLTLVSIAGTLVLGIFLGRTLSVTGNVRSLIAFGTAICGGSAIAAMAPVLKAKGEEIAVSLATVFALNALALLLFPPLGELFRLDQQQFGLWSALAIHDTSSVVGASATFGAAALTVGTTTKLTRALWIMPFVLAASFLCHSERRVAVPLFVVGFVAAALTRDLFPGYSLLWGGIYAMSKQLLVMVLFLVGAGLTRPVLRQVGLKPLLFGGALWVIVSASTLALIVQGYIY